MSDTPDGSDAADDAGAIVTAFCDAWTRGDADAVMAAFQPDATYHNIPWEPLVGVDAIDGFVRPFLETSTIGFEILHQVVDGDLVMNERIDTLDLGEGPKSIPVMGVFELRDGKIAAWRDYFDVKMFTG
ncbi:MAG: limonene-1,2-epoxide hydrolase family protein [Actinomycetota bacterium]